ncbi:AAA family ATPase [Kineosporia succinea]|uniref:Kinase n=1 Tax=Kineosporia succinea TaxID=84632 RepID=A0ABT9P2M3_9ACTN|nr:AAA family ATPase [Kineosporia succinea]MDP9826933.1 putative kinase [Kineosporia succinea]
MPPLSDTHLIVIRGNSGSGKSTVAQRLRLQAGRGWALVEQDFLRRIVLREREHERDSHHGHGHHDTPSLAPAFIAHNVTFLLQHGYHVILEGILHSPRYGDMLRTLAEAHNGPALFVYLDASFEETVKRHATRPQASEFTPAHMREWYSARDLLGQPTEMVIPENSTLDQTLAAITTAAGL